MRLDKYLSLCRGCTRSQGKAFLKKGLVTVNQETEKRPERRIDPGKDQVALAGEILSYQEHVYLMFHKPAGCVTAVHDREHRTVMDYLPKEGRRGLFPVGRLDLDTEGLLLLTDDGELCHRLLAPGRHVEKTYYAVLERPVSREDQEAFREGLDIGEKRRTLPASLSLLERPDQAMVTVVEGKFHQIKRMFQARKNRVVYLKRIRMGGISLDESLKPGEWRELTEEEIERLRSLC